MLDVKNGYFKSYSEYIDIQALSAKESRNYLQICYYDSFENTFKGKIERINFSNKTILFKRIMVNGIYPNGRGFKGIEDHVWIKVDNPNYFSKKDCISFSADVYRYMKHGKGGKKIDYSLYNLKDIKEISCYQVPTNDELIDQQIRQLVYETHLFNKHSNINNEVIINKKEFDKRVNLLKSLEPGKFTPLTVLLAYELEYKIVTQTGGIHLNEIDKKDPRYNTMKRFVSISNSASTNYTGDPQEAFIRMTHPETPRIYITE